MINSICSADGLIMAGVYITKRNLHRTSIESWDITGCKKL
jgi:hypothetical protein